MKTTKKFTLLAFLVLLALSLAAGSVLADGGEKVVIGSKFTLETNERLNGSLMIVGGDVVLENGSVVTGSVMQYGGDLEANGTIEGSLSGFGGDLKLGSESMIAGDLVTFGTDVQRANGAVVGGNTMREKADKGEIEQIVDEKMNEFDMEPYREHAHQGFWGSLVSFLSQAFLLIIKILVMVVFAIFVMLILDKKVLSTGSTLTRYPWQSLGIGFLIFILTPCVVVALCVTVILIPVALLICLAFVALCIYAWVVMGAELGQRLAEWMHLKWEAIWLAAFGTFVLSFVLIGFAKVVPCIGWMPLAFALLFGTGAVIIHMTHMFGEGKRNPGERQLLQARNEAPRPTAQADVNQPVPGVAAPETKPVKKDVNEVVSFPAAASAETPKAGEEVIILPPVEEVLEEAADQPETPTEAEASETPKEDEAQNADEKPLKAVKRKGVASSMLDSLHDDINEKKE